VVAGARRGLEAAATCWQFEEEEEEEEEEEGGREGGREERAGPVKAVEERPGSAPLARPVLTILLDPVR